MNIAEILKDCPKGTKLYSPIFGEVTFVTVDPELAHPIKTTTSQLVEVTFTEDGIYNKIYDGECLLFPSKENRDWSTFKVPKKEYNFKPFDKVLVRDDDSAMWTCDLFSFILDDGHGYKYTCVAACWEQCIPFAGNEHLVGTTNKPE